MPSPSAHQQRSTTSRTTAIPHVYFGYDTALEICRHAHPSLLRPVSRPRLLPLYAPHKAELDAALADISAACFGHRAANPAHVLIGSTKRFKASARYHPHACTREMPRRSFYRIGEHHFTATPELAFTQMATKLSLVELIELGYEICGTYWRNRSNQSCAYHLQPLTSTARLANFVQRNSSLPGARKAQQAARYLADNSASPRESKLAIILLLPTRYGGYGFNGLRMNHTVIASQSAKVIANRRYFKCDLCWPEKRIDLEYQSKENHAGESHRIADSRRANALKSMSWHVIEITNSELDSYAATNVIIESIAKRIGKRQRTQIDDYRLRQLKLRQQLNLPYEGGERFCALHEEL